MERKKEAKEPSIVESASKEAQGAEQRYCRHSRDSQPQVKASGVWDASDVGNSLSSWSNPLGCPCSQLTRQAGSGAWLVPWATGSRRAGSCTQPALLHNGLHVAGAQE